MNKILVVAAALLVSGTTFAGAPTRTTMPVASNPSVGGFYVGAGVNYNAMTKAPGLHHHWGYSLFLGQRLNNWFAHEFNFSKIGNTVTAKDIYHTSYDVYGFLPLTKGVEAFAKGGVSYLSHKDMGDAKYGKFTLNYGVGLQYTYQQFGVRAAFTRVTNTSNASDNRSLDVVGVDAFYRLG